MSTKVVTKKRKSVDGADKVVKKAKISKSAEKPAPLKSALKKPTANTTEEIEVTEPVATKPKTTKISKKSTTASNVSDKTTLPDTTDTNTELTRDQTAALLAGFSSSEDEDEADDSEEKGVAISSLPKPPTAGLIQKRIRQAVAEQSDPETTPGVIYIGRIPHGFYEHQMRAYFSQFGEILNLKLARNRKTGRSKGFAFVKFASAAVAEIVVKTMDKYILFGHLLQVKRVPNEQVKEEMWLGSQRRKKPAPFNRLEGAKLKRGASREVWEKRVEREREKRRAKEEKLRELGYEFDMPEVKDVKEVPVKEELVQGTDEAADTAVEVVQVETGVEDPEKTIPQKRAASSKTRTKKAAKKVKT